MQSYPETLGALKRSPYAAPHRARRSVKDEVRANLITKLGAGGEPPVGRLRFSRSDTPTAITASSHARRHSTTAGPRSR